MFCCCRLMRRVCTPFFCHWIFHATMAFFCHWIFHVTMATFADRFESRCSKKQRRICFFVGIHFWRVLCETNIHMETVNAPCKWSQSIPLVSSDPSWSVLRIQRRSSLIKYPFWGNDASTTRQPICMIVFVGIFFCQWPITSLSLVGMVVQRHSVTHKKSQRNW